MAGFGARPRMARQSPRSVQAMTATAAKLSAAKPDTKGRIVPSKL